MNKTVQLNILAILHLLVSTRNKFTFHDMERMKFIKARIKELGSSVEWIYLARNKV